MLVLIAIIALIFFLPPGLGAAAVLLALAAEAGEFVLWKRFLRRYGIGAGPETMIGQPGRVIEACEPLGTVRTRGEIWKARSSTPAGPGEEVTVVALDGLTLDVEPARRC